MKMDSTNPVAARHVTNPDADGNFFHFTAPDEPRLIAEWADGNDHAITSDGDTRAWLFQRPFRCIVRKRQMADIIWSGGQCIISDRILSLFREEGITGFEAHPANARLMFPHDPKETAFWLLTVTGWGGMARPDSGITRLEEDPSGLGRLVYSPCTNPGAIIDAKQWDGSDFFIVWPLPMYWWITSKVAALLKKHKLKRFRLIPPQELTFTTKSGEVGFGPGRLHQYFSEQRAKEIGGPLGIY